MEQKTIPADKLKSYIWQDIRKEVYSDRVELYLPFCFGSGNDTPLCLTWRQDGTLSDGGRTLAELKNRLGDITTYMDTIQEILARCYWVELVGGQNLVMSHFQTCIRGEEYFYDYVGGLTWMLQVISLISIVDTITVEER